MDTKEYVLSHIRSVRVKLEVIIEEFKKRLLHHDQSKLESPEYELWRKMDEEPRYKYGTPEYFDKIQRYKKVFDLHYKHNSHHPEHYENRILDMDLVDVLEMLIDWISYKNNIRITEAIELIDQQSKRYNLSEELTCILKNTLINYFCVLVGDKESYVLSDHRNLYGSSDEPNIPHTVDINA